jgi:hypothetical protein
MAGLFALSARGVPGGLLALATRARSIVLAPAVRLSRLSERRAGVSGGLPALRASSSKPESSVYQRKIALEPGLGPKAAKESNEERSSLERLVAECKVAKGPRAVKTSRYLGVSYMRTVRGISPLSALWRARMRLAGKDVVLGYFKTEEAAADKYRDTVEEHGTERQRKRLAAWVAPNWQPGSPVTVNLVADNKVDTASVKTSRYLGDVAGKALSGRGRRK